MMAVPDLRKSMHSFGLTESMCLGISCAQKNTGVTYSNGSLCSCGVRGGSGRQKAHAPIALH